jgi:hypothetical protein
MLPVLDKKVIYLDQHAVSEIFKISSGTRRSGANSAFEWSQIAERIARVVKLQQAVIPLTSIHFEETALFPDHSALRIAHAMLGDVHLLGWQQINDDQEIFFFEKFLNSEAIEFYADVDEIIASGDRKSWLPVLHLDVEMDLTSLQKIARKNRALLAGQVLNLWNYWVETKATFESALQKEYEDTLPSYEKLLNSRDARILSLFNYLCSLAEKSGLSVDDAVEKVIEFWGGAYVREVPSHKIFNYMFASLAHEAWAGRRKAPNGSILNDIKAVAAYTPYVDAIFLDNECARLLKFAQRRAALPVRARVFSMSNKAEFIAYLDD